MVVAAHRSYHTGIIMNSSTLEALNRTILCHAETIYRKNGVWEGPNPLNPILPPFILQLTVAILATRFILLVLKPFNQPPFVGEILSGIMLGPSVLGRNREFQRLLFPTYSFPVLEPMAHFALVYHAFLMGVQMDIRALTRTGSKTRNIFLAGLLIPFAIGFGLFFIFDDENKKGSFFWGAALAVTGFSVLSRLLEKQKILHTEAGKTTLSSALLSDFSSWILLAIGLALSSSGATVHWAMMCTCAFVVFCVYCVRPGLLWIIRRTPEGQGHSEYYVCFILTGVALCGIFTDACGTHPVIGAFVFGLIIPNEVLESTLVERLEDFVLGVLMPVFFTVCGLRTNVDVLTSNSSWAMVGLVMLVLCSAKVLGTLVVSLVCNMTLSEGLNVGILANTKGIMAMIFLEVGQEQGALSTQTYTIMVVAVLMMTMFVTPISMLQYQPSKNVLPYKRRTIQKAKPEEELRILACLHGMRNVPAVISLLEASNSSQRSPISIFALHLVELVGRASATLVVHNSRKAGPRNPNHTEAQTEQIISSFDNFELRREGVVVQALTARSAYSTMDEDICNIAKDKRSSFIILPFHKQQTIDGEMEDINPAIRSVNENVLANAPCSVGILIDRGLSESSEIAHRIAMLFLGGPDDREALAYAWRMSENESISLQVVRLVPGQDALQMEPMEFVPTNNGAVTLNIDTEREKVLDDDFLNKFKIFTANDPSIAFSEMVLNDEEETVRAIKSMDGHHDLYIVGRGRGVISPLTAGLADWCDCPELGAIGDLLVTSEFSSPFSVVVMQQYLRGAGYTDGSVRSSSSMNLKDDLQPMEWRIDGTENEEFASFGSHLDERDHSH